MHLASLIVAGFLSLSSTLLQASPTVGETAHYKLDRSRNRTTSLIQSGTFTLKVDEHLPQHPEGEAFKVLYNYKLSIMFGGDQNGSGETTVLAQYFTQEFLDKVKKDEVVTTDQFKVRYLGTENVSTKNETYANCDIIQIYDIKTQQLDPMLAKMLLEAANQSLAEDDPSMQMNELKDVKVKAAVKTGKVPVFGAAKIDISAIARGMNVRAGFDYEAPRK